MITRNYDASVLMETMGPTTSDAPATNLTASTAPITDVQILNNTGNLTGGRIVIFAH